jgi:hypothetical protein
VAVCPMRKEASHKSEMVSQMLFGETAESLEQTKDFTRIRCLYDNYEGWVQTSQVTEVDKSFLNLTPSGFSYKRNAHVLINGEQMFLSVATPIFYNGRFGKYHVEYLDEYILEFEEMYFDSYIIKMVSLLYQNVPYLWGGKSSFGIDCSGFTQMVFRMFNKKLFRDSCRQATQGEEVECLKKAECGDLAFFNNENGLVTHAGILLSSEEIIHASGRVRIDKIDNDGIINTDTGQRTHKLKAIKRI